MLRSYPAGFGDAICKLLPEIRCGGEGCPEVDESIPPTVVFDAMPFTTWPEAHLGPCIKYLRGNRHLKFPPEWLKVLPRPFEILNGLENRHIGAM